ncbi:hypothetical protein HBO32_18005 [Pseudomonas nitroreducens]|uniref:MarR family transcriptional regulator n=1 Tax=Pseudomonas nitroreducens TaxID=46680 RepID=UPI001475245F|nr:MarR family transcriptional regulator [Pseudomonas nitroreducens]NMZ75003.1 hypothetical protein [Pseudomonas nitroreducens]
MIEWGWKIRINTSENQDKGHFDNAPCRSFLWDACLPLRARYLLFQLVRLYSLGQPEHTTIGGVERLAKDTGFSKDGVSRNLSILVSQGVLVREQKATQGRPRAIYRLNRSMQKKLLRHWSMTHLASWLSRILCGDEPPFNALSKSERSLLALLWGQVESPRVCVLDGQSVSKLAKKASIDSSTFYALTNQLHQKGMLVLADAEFAADGKSNKTKTYFLLGPEVMNCWSHAFTWHVRIEAKEKATEQVILYCLSSSSGECSSERLLKEVESLTGVMSREWKDVRDKLPGFWDGPGIRHYVLIQCCAALSHAFSNERAFLWDSRVLYVKIQSALLRVLGLPIAGADVHYRVIEDFDLIKLATEQRALFLFAEELSILLVEALKQIFPVSPNPQDLGKKVRLLSCYPVAVDGIQQMRIDLVTDDEVAGAKFGAYLLSENKRNGLELPEQLQVGAKD